MTNRSGATLVALPLLALLVAGASFWPVPYVIYSPGVTVNVLGTQDGKEVIEVSGHRAYRDDGQLRMTTVYVTQPEGKVNLFEALYAWLDPDRSVYPHDSVYPREITTEQNRQESAVQMVSSQDAAIANALRELGYTVPEVTEVQLVVDDMPAQGQLEVRDVLRKIGDTRITGPQDVVDAVEGAPVNQPLAFRVLRDGERVDLSITPKQVDGKNRIGIVPGPGYDFPFEVKVNIDPAIGGPSAGLIFSLAVYDTLTPGSLTEDGAVAGTGTIDDAGTVGPIGGIEQKIAAARDAGAGLFLVPSGNCEASRDADPGDMRLVKATTMKDALGSVEAWADDPDAALPAC